MIALTWQTLLVLALAYFAGCIVGCVARKIKGVEPARSGLAPMGGGGLALAPAVADSGPSPVEAFAPSRPPAPVRPVQGAFRRADHDAPSDAAPSPVSAPAAAPVADRSPQASASGDDLTRIRAIDKALAAKLHAAGVRSYGEIAAWTSEEVKAISETLGSEGRIERENWIEQAHILARGGVTQYATAIARVAPAAVSAPAAVPPATPGDVAPASPPDVPARAAFGAPRGEVAVAPAAVAPSASGREDLQRIGGISGEIETVLNAHGVTRYSQVAGWGSADIRRLEGLLGFSGRISRENWIEQAQILANGGATAYSREFDRAAGVTATPPAAVAMPAAPAPASTPLPPAAPAATPVTGSGTAERSQAVASQHLAGQHLAGMRSVRSEAYRADDSFAAAPSTRTPDDLKRIRGIGVLLEKKLNAMGISTYEQIANWTADDVGAVNNKLEFKGRIERENWIEQARILASGGQTDFSRRFERGEV
jgi:predicted flap endonuclease-1-like 5' DNA nuclease